MDVNRVGDSTDGLRTLLERTWHIYRKRECNLLKRQPKWIPKPQHQTGLAPFSFQPKDFSVSSRWELLEGKAGVWATCWLYSLQYSAFPEQTETKTAITVSRSNELDSVFPNGSNFGWHGPSLLSREKQNGARPGKREFVLLNPDWNFHPYWLSEWPLGAVAGAVVVAVRIFLHAKLDPPTREQGRGICEPCPPPPVRDHLSTTRL